MSPEHPVSGPRVCLTFDFDAMSTWIRGTAPGAINYTDLSRGEFAARVGVPRTLSLLHHHGVATTWFIPGQTIETYPELCREIRDRGHEIAHHGYLHEMPLGLSRDEEGAALAKGISACERHLGQRPLGYRAPTWAMSENSVDLLLGHGFSYDSSLMGDDFSFYRCRTGDVPRTDGPYEFGPEVDLVEIPVSWSHSDFPRFELLLHPGVLAVMAPYDEVKANWMADFHYMCETVPDGVFTLVLHPDTIGRGARMRLLDELISAMKAGGASFHRADELVRQWREEHPVDIHEPLTDDRPDQGEGKVAPAR
jgi:peptidoglycan/xylan/chitin deacetylase (PgdA/CDA1 family)